MYVDPLTDAASNISTRRENISWHQQLLFGVKRRPVVIVSLDTAERIKVAISRQLVRLRGGTPLRRIKGKKLAYLSLANLSEFCSITVARMIHCSVTKVTYTTELVCPVADQLSGLI